MLHSVTTTIATMTRAYRIHSDQNYAYFLTFTVVEWLQIFKKDYYQKIVLDALNYMRTHKHTQLNAFVIMPSHVHAILLPETGINLSDVIRDFKRHTSREISKEARLHSELDFLRIFEKARSENRSQESSIYQVWQEGSHPEAIFSKKFAQQKLDYIHLNPVRAGLVEDAEAWPYSSARAYTLGQETYPPVDSLWVE